MTFSGRLSMAIRDHGYTTQQFAAASGVDAQDLYRYRKGQRTPSMLTLGKIVQALPDVDVRWLVGDGR